MSIVPVLVFVNVTCSGGSPESGEALKLAVGVEELPVSPLLELELEHEQELLEQLQLDDEQEQLELLLQLHEELEQEQLEQLQLDEEQELLEELLEELDC